MRAAIGSSFISKDTEICTRYQEIFIRLGHHPSTEEEMVELETFLGQSTDLLANLNTELNEARKALRFLIEQVGTRLCALASAPSPLHPRLHLRLQPRLCTRASALSPAPAPPHPRLCTLACALGRASR